MFRFILAAALLGAIILPFSLPASDLKPQSRMNIIRGLTAEYATLKVTLPRGRKGLELSADGQVDRDSLQRELMQNGTAQKPNVLVQITAIAFQDKAIVFEINGGGKHKSKWYDHVEVGMGDPTMGGPIGPDGVPVGPDGLPPTTPIHQPQAATPTGSYITLVFPKKLQDLTVEELKKYLSPALDFNPTNSIMAISRPVPPQFKAAIEAKKAAVGMDREMVLAAMGPPQRKIRETKDGVEQEDWIYSEAPFKVTFVTFEEGEVVNVREYTGGMGGAVQSASETDDPTPR